MDFFDLHKNRLVFFCYFRAFKQVLFVFILIWSQLSFSIGYEPLPYELPKPGTYVLPHLGSAANGDVVTSDGQETSLHQLFGGKNTLLAFIYTSCSDVNGCPLASYVLYRIRERMQEDKVLHDNLQLVSLSFDPVNDTPDVMRMYEKNFTNENVENVWQFVTTSDHDALEPILTEYNQVVQLNENTEAGTSSVISHMLRVYLIDKDKAVRNIYNADFLHDELVINDVLTLISKKERGQKLLSNFGERFRSGDFREGYNGKSFSTRTQSIETRLGEEADLIDLAVDSMLGLKGKSDSFLNESSAARVSLGRKLFYDRRLSLNDTFSCAMCHIPEQGFASNEMATAVGIEGRTVRRNTPTILNVGFLDTLFHDGRESALEHQIWAPLLAQNEMGNPSIGYVLNKIENLEDYSELFDDAFPKRGLTMENLGVAMAAYQKVLVAGNSPFDQWYFNREGSISDSAKRGFEIFSGKGNCIACHSVEADKALFTDQQFHNTGIGFARSMGLRSGKLRVNLAPGVFVSVDDEIINSFAEKSHSDLGRYEVTQKPQDRWKYRTPSLRNVDLTAPYMHDGSLATLTEVIRFYNQGGEPNEDMSSLIYPLNLEEKEITYLVEFLKSLTGSNVETLVADAFAAPIGDVISKDKIADR